MRGFVAFGLDAQFSALLRAEAETFPLDPALKLLLPGDYHVTIKFLSNFSSTDFFSCLDELCAIGKPPANSLRAGKIALWPTVIALECEPTEELREWHSRVNALLERKGFIQERHPRFSPHITLARHKAGQALPEVESHLPKVASAFSGMIVPVEAPALWKSEPEETGRRHRAILSPLFE
jgi:2'-5' RNA ligase